MQKRLSRYLIAGIWNTASAYVVFVVMYKLLHPYLHTIGIGSIAAATNVAQSFVIHKVFVFKTKGNWFQELGKSYVVNSFALAVGILLLWLLVDILDLIIYLAQAAVTFTLAVISYIGHLTFTFRHQLPNKAELQRSSHCEPPSD